MLLSDVEVIQVFARFKQKNPFPKPELNYYSPFTLLVAVVLSAKTMDKAVNKVTEKLFKRADTPREMLTLSQDELISYIKPLGLYKEKSWNILGLCRKLCTDFNEEVPDNIHSLLKLPGVGRKTANVVLNVIFDKPTMPVDTHVFRVSHRLGLSDGKTPLEVEKSLVMRIPACHMKHAHHWILLHGRYVCTANKAKCSSCMFNDICKHNDV